MTQSLRKKLERFVRQVAGLTKDGECLLCGKDGYEPNPACSDHKPWDMANDDAYDTLHSLISGARALQKELEDAKKPKETKETEG